MWIDEDDEPRKLGKRCGGVTSRTKGFWRREDSKIGGEEGRARSDGALTHLYIVKKELNGTMLWSRPHRSCNPIDVNGPWDCPIF